jgi:hypothetical protein
MLTIIQSFKLNSPFLAPIIADVIHEIWFATPKAFGFKDKSVKSMVSRVSTLPAEKELPTPMICLAAANVCVTLSFASPTDPLIDIRCAAGVFHRDLCAGTRV